MFEDVWDWIFFALFALVVVFVATIPWQLKVRARQRQEKARVRVLAIRSSLLDDVEDALGRGDEAIARLRSTIKDAQAEMRSTLSAAGMPTDVVPSFPQLLRMSEGR